MGFAFLASFNASLPIGGRLLGFLEANGPPHAALVLTFLLRS
jgi:hypothetical protein